MRIESSSVLLAGASTSVETHTKEESLKTWVGNTRPTFEGEKPINLFITPENTQQGDSLKLSAEGKAALEKQMASVTAGVAKEVEPQELYTDREKQKILMLQKMLELLTGKKLRFVFPDKEKLSQLKSEMKPVQLSGPIIGQPVNLTVRQNQGWGLEYDLHETHYEKQTMNFAAGGTVRTADGREISFDLNLSMSREFYSSLDVSLRAGDAVKVDPLVINFDGPTAALTNNKFSFDIDADGDEDQISFATSGSGFLAYDLNNDGIINDGSELFGPQSGNGFNDLALYDEDGNGWIDENDDIYSKLRIWSKDENGNDQLFALGVKGVGAIYLGNTATAFDVKTNSNQTLGSIARSGIFLKESGQAGTIQHVDLVI